MRKRVMPILVILALIPALAAIVITLVAKKGGTRVYQTTWVAQDSGGLDKSSEPGVLVKPHMRVSRSLIGYAVLPDRKPTELRGVPNGLSDPVFMTLDLRDQWSDPYLSFYSRKTKRYSNLLHTTRPMKPQRIFAVMDHCRDYNRRCLYVDLNRNGDLSDDPALRSWQEMAATYFVFTTPPFIPVKEIHADSANPNGVGLSIAFPSDIFFSSRKDWFGMLHLTGYWETRIDTPFGRRKVFLYDSNGNGRYDDLGVDILAYNLDHVEAPFTPGTAAYLNTDSFGLRRTVTIDWVTYDIRPSPYGEKLYVKPLGPSFSKYDR